MSTNLTASLPPQVNCELLVDFSEAQYCADWDTVEINDETDVLRAYVSTDPIPHSGIELVESMNKIFGPSNVNFGKALALFCIDQYGQTILCSRPFMMRTLQMDKIAPMSLTPKITPLKSGVPPAKVMGEIRKRAKKRPTAPATPKGKSSCTTCAQRLIFGPPAVGADESGSSKNE
jgi:hypothetical protein